jgi:chemotaxis protein histidine kinase CheA
MDFKVIGGAKMDSRKVTPTGFNNELPAPRTFVIENVVEDVLATYVEEMDSLLSRLEMAAMSLESGRDSDEAFAEVRRILHSIKGDSGMCGVTDVQSVCHELESELDELQRNGSLADTLLKVTDWMEGVIYHLSATDLKEARRKGMERSKSKPKLRALVINDDIVCR